MLFITYKMFYLNATLLLATSNSLKLNKFYNTLHKFVQKISFINITAISK